MLLQQGKLRVVQLSLLGSILSNMLLVLGCAFFFGGLKYSSQTFHKEGRITPFAPETEIRQEFCSVRGCLVSASGRRVENICGRVRSWEPIWEAVRHPLPTFTRGYTYRSIWLSHSVLLCICLCVGVFASCGLLLLGVLGLMLPNILHATHTELHGTKDSLDLSRYIACLMLVMYGAYLVFQVRASCRCQSPCCQCSLSRC